MSHFDAAIEVVLKHEGGYSNHVSDPGGATKYGITKRDYPWLDIVNLTREAAMKIYRDDYWRPQYDEIDSELVACKIFDMAVNMGHRQAHKIVQRAAMVADDGIFGSRTLKAINATHPAHLLQRIKEEQCKFYLGLIADRPGLAAFKNGWLARAGWPPQERYIG